MHFGTHVSERRVISREIKLKRPIGTGRFGKVYTGDWQGTDIAVKIFDSIDDAR